MNGLTCDTDHHHAPASRCHKHFQSSPVSHQTVALSLTMIGLLTDITDNVMKIQFQFTLWWFNQMSVPFMQPFDPMMSSTVPFTQPFGPKGWAALQIWQRKNRGWDMTILISSYWQSMWQFSSQPCLCHNLHCRLGKEGAMTLDERTLEVINDVIAHGVEGWSS